MQARSTLAGVTLVAVLGFTAFACTAIVAGELSDSDKLAATDAASSKCALVEGPDAGNTCATCIQTNCSSDVMYACNGGDDKKNWFQDLKNCAENPFEGPFSSSSDFNWQCSMYEDAAVVVTGTDDNARQHASENCVFDKCMNAAAPPCHQCIPTVSKGAAGTGTLDDSACGQCLRAACPGTIVQCCTDLPPELAKCGYLNDPQNKTDCLSLADAGADPRDSGITGGTEVCRYRVSTECFTTQCQTVCANGT